MKAAARYLALFSFIVGTTIVWKFHQPGLRLIFGDGDDGLEPYITLSEIHSLFQPDLEGEDFETSSCSMSRCFNMSQCLSQNDFKVFVYPTDGDSVISTVYTNILKVLRESSYHTDDYTKACVFILGIDTTDRDRRSENFVKHVNDLIHSLPSAIWNEGRNHIIFNLYHGTFPDYSDHDLGFDVGYAMIARASANAQVFRRDFDLSFPLFHQEHPLRTFVEPIWPLKLKDRHLVSFKGKRYVYGIGSETRDSLYHLHNRQSSVMVTTCRHNTDWKKYEDQRCEEDNIEYEKWEYEAVMSNSTFCLTPRGRRLGSFRFLESLRLGCIPVVLSDDWVLPFSEVIDWPQAAVVAHEDSVLTITDVLKAIPLGKVIHMKQQARGLYQKYFSSVEKIVFTSIEIVKERIDRQRGSPKRAWNSEIYARSISIPLARSSVLGKCDVVLQSTAKISGRLQRKLQLLAGLQFVAKIIVLWPTSRGVSPENVISNGKSIEYVVLPYTNQSSMFSVLHTESARLNGDWLLLVDERVQLTKDDVVSLYSIATSEPEKLTGVYSASHKKRGGNWSIEFESFPDQSIVLPHLLVLKRAFLSQFWSWIPAPAKAIAQKIPHCFTILLNFMMTELSSRPPVFALNRTLEPWMHHRDYNTCFKEMIPSVWPSGPSLVAGRTRIESVLWQPQLEELT